jgi:hypothetical protein
MITNELERIKEGKYKPVKQSSAKHFQDFFLKFKFLSEY